MDTVWFVVIAPFREQFSRAEVDEHEVLRKNRGYSGLWSPMRCTVVYLGTVAIGLMIIEMSEEVKVRYVNGEYVREQDYIPPKRRSFVSDRSWTTTEDFPTGRLRLQAYSPYPGTTWTKRWQETKDGSLDNQVSTIIKELEQAAVDVARLVEEAQRQLEIQQKSGKPNKNDGARKKRKDGRRWRSRKAKLTCFGLSVIGLNSTASSNSFKT